jgi:hypothetical protein
MAVLSIIAYPDPRLRLRCEPVAAFDNGLSRLIDDLIETRRATNELGLAAPQVGDRRQVLVVDVSGGASDFVDWVKLREERESFVYDSGCLRCHQKLAQETASTPAASLAHRAYFLGDSGAAEQDAVAPQETRTVGDLAPDCSLVVVRSLTAVGQGCIACHAEKSPGIVNDWRRSRHAHAGVSCLDGHQVAKDAPNATQHASLKGTEV